jgi:hypothetical protein
MATKSKKLKASFEKVPDLGDFVLKRLKRFHWASDELMVQREHGSLCRSLGNKWEHRTVINKVRVAVRDTVLGTRHFLWAILEPDPENWDFLWQYVDWSRKFEAVYSVTLGRALRNQQIVIVCPYSAAYDEDLRMLRKSTSWQNGPRRLQIIALLSWIERLMDNMLRLCRSCCRDWFDPEMATLLVDYSPRIRFTKPRKVYNRASLPIRESSSHDISGPANTLAALSS